MPDSYRVAAIQFEPLLGNKAENIARLLRLAQTAARGGARLIVLPEMATTGYCWYNRDEIRPYVEPIPGPTTKAFGALAREHDCYIVVGMPELAPHSGIFYNSAVLIGPAGVIGVYRKTHSFASDLRWAKDGDLGLPVWETPLGTIGIMVCMDAGYFEPARLLALRGADVVCFPTNWLGERCPGPAWITRAWENGCYLICANRYGLERGVQFSGGSCVLDPDGTIQALCQTGDGIVYGEVAPAAARERRLAARRPELYDNLTLNAYLWAPLEYHGLYGQRPLPAGCRSRVAVVQLKPHPGNPAANLSLVERALAQLDRRRPARSRLPRPGHSARRRGQRPRRLTLIRRPPKRDNNRRLAPELVVLPEYMLTGCPHAGATHIALDTHSAAAAHERLAALARQHKLHLVAGYAEHSDEQTFSAAVLVGPQGVVAHYRKTHVVGDEAAWCSRGMHKPPIVDLPLGRVGLLIGSDLCFPELARSLAIEGCDVLAVPAGPELPPSFGLAAGDADGKHGQYHFHLARQRAFENNCYLAFAALPYPCGNGNSAVFGPDPDSRAGEGILGSAANGVAVRTTDTCDAVRAKDLVGKRRTDLYDELQTLK